MAATIEDRVRMMVGGIMIDLQAAQMQIEELQRRISELEGPHRVRPEEALRNEPSC